MVAGVAKKISPESKYYSGTGSSGWRHGLGRCSHIYTEVARRGQMKMGTIASPWRYDGVSDATPRLPAFVDICRKHYAEQPDQAASALSGAFLSNIGAAGVAGKRHRLGCQRLGKPCHAVNGSSSDTPAVAMSATLRVTALRIVDPPMLRGGPLTPQ
jgi:hypothetical protein